jgi:L,D-transpeptidase YcbB
VPYVAVSRQQGEQARTAVLTRPCFRYSDWLGAPSQDVRDFSHGCIRVEQPADLVARVLRNNPGWSMDRVKATLSGEKDNVRVNLTKQIPVLIVYGTAAVNEENQIRFFDDIYGYDAALERALSARPD